MKIQNYLEKTISKVAGVNVEITILNVKKFSYFFEGQNNEAVNKIKNYFKDLGTFDLTIEPYDLECDSTCLFFTAN